MNTNPITNSLSSLYSRMVEEKGSSVLSDERQAYYLRKSRFEFAVLGAMNPFCVDPSREIEAFHKIQSEVSSDGYW